MSVDEAEKEVCRAVILILGGQKALESDQFLHDKGIVLSRFFMDMQPGSLRMIARAAANLAEAKSREIDG